MVENNIYSSILLFRGGARDKIRMPIRIKDPAGPAYPPKSLSDAKTWENWDKTLDASTATSDGDIESLIKVLFIYNHYKI